MPNESQQKTCRRCSQTFSVTAEDLAFYDKISPTIAGKKYAVPAPTLCPDCRLQRRLSLRNERNIFKRSCSLCKKETFSFFHKDTPFPVYCPPCWWSDKWDPLDYGRDFDFNRPFFEQFKELMNEVPKMAMLQLSNENSDYNTLLAYSKNTYMSPGSYFMEDCYYTRKSQYSKDCLNGIYLDHCELVGESVNCQKCYGSTNLINCRNCSDSRYLADSTGCESCFMCGNLSNKKYHIKNKPYSKEEYGKIVAEKMKEDPKKLMEEFLEFRKAIPKRFQNQINCENSSGDYMQNCKNATECYDCFDIEDGKYLMECVNIKDCMDVNLHDKDIELCYEVCTGGESNKNLHFSFCACASPESDYLYSCFYLSNGFGCDGVRTKKQYCILNKQYSKEEYFQLKAKIIEHMIQTKEWGEFFPASISLHPYNETTAHDWFPLTKQEAIKNGYTWQDKDPGQYQPASIKLPQNIEEIPDSITKETLACEECGKNYRIISQELALSKKLKQSLSPLCSDCRQLRLQSLKNPRKLHSRKCDKCQKPIETTYAPDRPETVYCEACYLKEVY